MDDLGMAILDEAPFPHGKRRGHRLATRHVIERAIDRRRAQRRDAMEAGLAPLAGR
jgi:hypothetical protein